MHILTDTDLYIPIRPGTNKDEPTTEFIYTRLYRCIQINITVYSIYRLKERALPVQICTGLYKFVQLCTGESVTGSKTSLYTSVQDDTKQYRSVQGLLLSE